MFSLSLMKTVVSYGKKHFHECFCFQNPLTKIVLVIIFCNYTIKLIHKRVNQTLHIDYNFLCNGNVGLLQICHYCFSSLPKAMWKKKIRKWRINIDESFSQFSFINLMSDKLLSLKQPAFMWNNPQDNC